MKDTSNDKIGAIVQRVINISIVAAMLLFAIGLRGQPEVKQEPLKETIVETTAPEKTAQSSVVQTINSIEDIASRIWGNVSATAPTKPVKDSIKKQEPKPKQKQETKNKPKHGYIEVYDESYNFQGYVPYDEIGLDHSNYDGEDEEYISTPGSSIFTEIKYDYIGKVLYVRFRNSGEGYCYYNVPYSVWDELKDADSMGSYFNSDIKGYYRYERGAW